MALGFAMCLSMVSCALPSRTEIAPPTWDELRHVSFDGAEPTGAAEPVGHFRVVGDLDGDGIEEAVVLLLHSPGGTGTWSSLAVVKRLGGRTFHTASARLGDRVQLRSARIEGGRLFASGVRTGPNDPACCPGELVDWVWALRDGRLDAIETRATGRLSLDALRGVTWVLRNWDEGAPAAISLTVTLAYASGRFAGTAGCNRYTASVADGNVPGDLTVGLPASTRMACARGESEVESRFLRDLAAARSYGFRAGQLRITSTAPSGPTTILQFERLEPSAPR